MLSSHRCSTRWCGAHSRGDLCVHPSRLHVAHIADFTAALRGSPSRPPSALSTWSISAAAATRYACSCLSPPSPYSAYICMYGIPGVYPLRFSATARAPSIASQSAHVITVLRPQYPITPDIAVDMTLLICSLLRSGMRPIAPIICISVFLTSCRVISCARACSGLTIDPRYLYALTSSSVCALPRFRRLCSDASLRRARVVP
eukprot:4774702-Prymnesium_polylepis.1